MPRTLRGRLLHIDGSEFEKPWVRAHEHKVWKPARPLVLVNGCFDVLHAGHLYVLEAARRVADGLLGPALRGSSRGSLLVSLDSDEMVRGAKGPGRPVLRWTERAAQLQYLPVDYIHECKSDEDFVALVKGWRPDARVRNEEYRAQPTRIKAREVWLPTLSNMSTSEVLSRLESVVRVQVG